MDKETQANVDYSHCLDLQTSAKEVDMIKGPSIALFLVIKHLIACILLHALSIYPIPI